MCFKALPVKRFMYALFKNPVKQRLIIEESYLLR